MSEFERLRAALKGQYDIKRQLGQGGMAVVYLAEDLKHQREVAVKVLRSDLAAALGPERFLREVKIAAKLHHPHILPLYDSGEAEGFLYYVMPYESGPSLREKLAKEGELPVDEAVRLLREIADALAHAHEHDLVHRDIKPDNVMLSGRHALVTDFGVAKAVSEAKEGDGITTAGVALGTPAYMAPEQAAADPHVDHRADIYAFGVMAYELLSGSPPFSGSTQAQVLAAHISEQPIALSEQRSTVPAQLDTLVMRCLEKRPSDRWQSAEELVPMLEAVVTPSGGTVPVAATSSTRARRKGLMVGAAAAVVVAGAAIWGLVRQPPQPELSPDRVAIFPFSVTGASDDVEYLGDGLVHLLSAALDGAGDLRTVDPHSILTAAGDDPTDVARATEISSRFGAGMYLLGSVTQVGPQRVQLSASLYSQDRDEPITTSTSGSPEDVLQLTGTVARDLLAGYSQSMVGRIDSLALLTTDSVDALKAYLGGMDLYRNSSWSEAIDAFQRAVQVDSSFALGHYMLSRAASWAERHELAMEASSNALRNSDRLSPRHQALLRASYAWAEGRPAEAERYALEVTRSYPNDFDGWYLLGEIRLHMGTVLGRPLGEAAEPFFRAMRIDPTRGDAWSHAYDAAMSARDLNALRELYELRGNPIGTVADSNPVGWRWRAAVATAENDVDAASTALREGRDWEEISFRGWGYPIIRVGVNWGNFPLAYELSQRWLDGNGVAGPLDRAWFRRLTYEFKLGQGQRRAAQRELELAKSGHRAEAMLTYGVHAASGFPPLPESELRVVRDSLLAWRPSDTEPCLDRDQFGLMCTHDGYYRLFREYLLAILDARLGDSERSLQRAEQVERWPQLDDDEQLQDDLARSVRALVANLEGRHQDAADELDGMSRTGEIAKVRGGRLYQYLIPNVVRAEAANELGRYEEAIRFYEVAGDYNPPYMPARNLRIGEIHEARGETQLAIERYSRFLNLWSDADPEYQPLVQEIRQRVAGLVGESGQ